MIANLYVAWQDESTRAWRTIARLHRTERGDYEMNFTRGADRLKSIPSTLFKMDVNATYTFSELIPLFKNKLPPRSRNDFYKMADWLDLSGNEDEFTTLSRFGLIPGSDSILIYPEPEIVGSIYKLKFFVHGIRHMHSDAVSLCDNLLRGSRLLPVLDVQNPVDRNAVALRCEDKTILIGYVPTFYAGDIHDILLDASSASSATVRVVKNNIDAPLQLRLFCEFEAIVSTTFRSLDTDTHKPFLKVA
jgi:hypothetical protein